MKTKKDIVIFVYGTLKKGFGNAGLLNAAEYLGTAEVKGNLYSYTFFPVAVLDEKGCGGTIKGELYNIGTDELVALDALEGYPAFYDRTEIKIKSGTTAWIYYQSFDKIKKQNLEQIKSGIWV